jgi:hypothetical protein
LRRLGVSATALDSITRERLHHWSRGQAALDEFEGRGETGSRDWVAAFNAATRSLGALEERLRATGLDTLAHGHGDADRLRRHLETTYGNQGGDS